MLEGCAVEGMQVTSTFFRKEKCIVEEAKRLKALRFPGTGELQGLAVIMPEGTLSPATASIWSASKQAQKLFGDI